MNNYGPSFAARRRLGLRWNGNHPPIAPTIKTAAGVVAGLLAMLAVNGLMTERDLSDKRLAQAEQSAASLRQFVDDAKAVPLKCTSRDGGNYLDR